MSLCGILGSVKFPAAEFWGEHLWKFLTNDQTPLVPPRYQVSGDYKYSALPKGRVYYDNNAQEYKICIDGASIFLNDIFNFEGFEFLGRWDLKTDKGMQFYHHIPSRWIFNSDFREFSQKRKFGRSFKIHSLPQYVGKLEGLCWNPDEVK